MDAVVGGPPRAHPTLALKVAAVSGVMVGTGVAEGWPVVGFDVGTEEAVIAASVGELTAMRLHNILEEPLTAIAVTPGL